MLAIGHFHTAVVQHSGTPEFMVRGAKAQRLLRALRDFFEGPGKVHKVPAPCAGAESVNARLITVLNAAREIRQIRIRASLTQAEFAQRLGMSAAQLVQVEIGEAGCLHTLQVCRQARLALAQADTPPGARTTTVRELAP